MWRVREGDSRKKGGDYREWKIPPGKRGPRSRERGLLKGTPVKDKIKVKRTQMEKFPKRGGPRDRELQ